MGYSHLATCANTQPSTCTCDVPLQSISPSGCFHFTLTHCLPAALVNVCTDYTPAVTSTDTALSC